MRARTAKERRLVGRSDDCFDFEEEEEGEGKMMLPRREVERR